MAISGKPSARSTSATLKSAAEVGITGSEVAKAFPPSEDDVNTTLLPSAQTTYSAPSAPTAPVKPSTLPLSSRGSPARVLMRIGGDQVVPWPLERENRITELSSVNSVQPMYRAPAKRLLGLLAAPTHRLFSQGVAGRLGHAATTR